MVGSYEIGRRMSHEDTGIYRIQAKLAFSHYKSYGEIADFLERKCYEDALKVAKGMSVLQLEILADNIRRTGNDPTLLEYIKQRDPGALKAALAGQTPEMQPYTTTCP